MLLAFQKTSEKYLQIQCHLGQICRFTHPPWIPTAQGDLVLLRQLASSSTPLSPGSPGQRAQSANV